MPCAITLSRRCDGVFGAMTTVAGRLDVVARPHAARRSATADERTRAAGVLFGRIGRLCRECRRHTRRRVDRRELRRRLETIKTLRTIVAAGLRRRPLALRFRQRNKSNPFAVKRLRLRGEQLHPITRHDDELNDDQHRDRLHDKRRNETSRAASRWIRERARRRNRATASWFGHRQHALTGAPSPGCGRSSVRRFRPRRRRRA
jgi:hypothetical protein